MPSPPSSLAALRTRYGPRYRWLSLGTVMLGTIASIMASTIVNVAVPDMSQHFSLGQDRAQWLAAGFMAAMTVSMPIDAVAARTPWLSPDLCGRGAAAPAGGIAGGLSNSYGLVLAMRVAEGLAAGVLQPIPAIIILRGFKPHEQGRAMGSSASASCLRRHSGRASAACWSSVFGWRSIFFVASPFCLLALPLAWKLLPHSAPGGAEVNAAKVRLDLAGLALATLTILLGLNGLARSMAVPPWRASRSSSAALARSRPSCGTRGVRRIR